MARLDLGQQDFAALAPNLDSGEAFYELGMMHAAGRSVPLDLVAAHKWLNVAVAKGCRAAVERRAELSAEMTGDEIAAAQREARLFLAGR
jgi:TPR repeat protein